MIVQRIKEILGAELAGQVEEALKGKGKDGADLDLVAGNDGTYVPKETYDMAVNQGKQSEETLKSVAAALKELGASGDAKNLAADVLKVKGDVAGMAEAHAAEMTRLQKTTALKLGLAGSVHDPEDIISRLKLEEVELDEQGNLKSSLEDMVKPIKEAKPYLFKEPSQQEIQLSGAVPGQVAGGAGSADGDVNAINAAFGLTKGE